MALTPCSHRLFFQSLPRSLKKQTNDPKLLPKALQKGWQNLWSAISSVKISLYSLKQGLGNRERKEREEHRAHL